VPLTRHNFRGDHVPGVLAKALAPLAILFCR
jgi:hypothetical protein